MSVTHIEVLVEEESMEAALRHLLPKLVDGISFEVYPYQGKSDLLRKLPQRLRGYSAFLPADWRIVVVMDRDDDDCRRLKQQLEDSARQAGLATRSMRPDGNYSVVTRLAIEELEAWYFGDWCAVAAAYPNVPTGTPRRRHYRDPDSIRGGTWEAFERVMQHAGYFAGGLRKIEAARTIALHWDPDKNGSTSFCAFRDAIRDLTA